MAGGWSRRGRGSTRSSCTYFELGQPRQAPLLEPSARRVGLAFTVKRDSRHAASDSGWVSAVTIGGGSGKWDPSQGQDGGAASRDGARHAGWLGAAARHAATLGSRVVAGQTRGASRAGAGTLRVSSRRRRQALCHEDDEKSGEDEDHPAMEGRINDAEAGICDLWG